MLGVLQQLRSEVEGLKALFSAQAAGVVLRFRALISLCDLCCLIAWTSTRYNKYARRNRDGMRSIMNDKANRRARTLNDAVGQESSSAALLPIMGAIFIAFLVIGMAMPVLPLHVHQTLELSTFVVGLVAGTQFGAAILSRVWAGRYADASGAKRAVIVGLLIAAMSGLVYLASLRFVANPTLSATILLLGRALLGVGESFIITGGQSWGLALLGLGNTSKVLAWVGSAMFAAFAAGAPVGAALYAIYGFAGVALATTLLPLATLALVAPLRPRSVHCACAHWAS